MNNAFTSIASARRTAETIRDYWLTRIQSEIQFAEALDSRVPELDAQASVKAAAGIVKNGIEGATVSDLPSVVAEAEAALSPLAEAAKAFAVYCVGHAHIDMNWMWGWQETVATTNDTFSTITRLLDEYPHFVFGQSQASVYRILEQYNPRILDRIREFVAAGRVEVTASHWVECDKNMVTGESLARHLLYTREYMKDLFDLSPEDVPIDWSPDTFGHARTVPSYLAGGGVRYLYMHRPGTGGTQPRPGAFRWRGPDGSEVLVRNDMHLGYNGIVEPGVLQRTLLRMFDELGLSYNLFVYGVGDHGGGPTRRDLENLKDMSEWPIFPTIQGAGSLEFYRRLDEDSADLPILDEELNFEFTGCYTTQSLIKRANAYGLRKMVETEAAATFASVVADREYPYQDLRTHWRNTLFHHFHDILPGSGVRDTRTHSHGMYQETMAFTGVATTESLRAIAERIDTARVASEGDAHDAATQIAGDGRPDQASVPTEAPLGMGGGIGRGSVDGGISTYGFGSGLEDPVFISYNLTAIDRATVVRATLWDSPAPESSQYQAVFADGAAVPCQLIESGSYWAHTYQTVGLPLQVDGYGYRTFRIRAVEPSGDPLGDDSRPESIYSELTSAGSAVSRDAASSDTPYRPGSAAQLGFHHVCAYAVYERGPEGLSNEFLDLHIDTNHGGIASLVHRQTGTEIVRSAGSVLEYVVERPRGMSAWEIEHYGATETPRVVGIRRSAEGPYVASIVVDVEIRSSRFTIEYRLQAGDPRVYVDISGVWFERGGRDIGTPSLRFALPLTLADAKPTYEIPFGAIERHMKHGEEVPALRWVDVSGTIRESDTRMGLLMANDCKHGHSLEDGVLRLTLLRSSFEPDPLPEIDEHRMSIVLEPHTGALTPVAASAAATAATEPVITIQSDSHAGSLDPDGQLLRVSGDVVVSAVKKSETGDGIIVRLYNPLESPSTVKIEHGPGLSDRIEKVSLVDLLERSLETGVHDGAHRNAEPGTNKSPTVAGGAISIEMPAHAIRTLLLQ